MRALELHAPVQQIQRSNGRSSVAAAAYRSGTRLEDERTGLVHDYTKKQGVEHSRIYLPDNAPSWAGDRSKLWNAAEKKENRSNSLVATELEISFPAEFNTMQRREAGDTLCRELMSRYGCAVDISYHQPSTYGDDRNFHAHILFTSRGFDASTKDGWEQKKYRDLSSDKITIDGEKTTRGKQEILSLRAFSAAAFNRIAERDRLQVRTEHLSFKKRGVDREPTQHRGNTATEMERNGKVSRIEDLNRDRQIRNAERANNHATAAQQAAAMAEKTMTEQWAHRKRIDLEGQSAAQKVEMANRHVAERKKLEKKLGNDISLKTMKTEINSINNRLQATGVKKVVRDIFRQTATDKNNLVNLQTSLKRIKAIEEQKRFELQERQRKELEKYQQQERQQKIIEEKNRSQSSVRGQADSRGQKSAQRKEPEQDNNAQPFPEPTPPREALHIAQQWAEKTGQNTREISKQVENRKIDTTRLKISEYEKENPIPMQKKLSLDEARDAAKLARDSKSPEPTPPRNRGLER